jgi:cupin 2 domain-containing protein
MSRLPRVANLFTPIRELAPGELVIPLLDTAEMRLEHIVSNAQPTPEGQWYDQPDPEWVLLARGKAVLAFDGEASVALIAGDHLLIPARRRHRVASCSADAVWVALHLRGATPDPPTDAPGATS